jgi:[acyl-carrier-protein] S-malonyltransferase
MGFSTGTLVDGRLQAVGMSYAVVFSGQGSQYVGMAKELVENDARASEMMHRANDRLGYSLSDIMFAGPDDVLRQTRYTQPALYVHEAILLACSDIHQAAVAVAGHSLGEFSALFAAGAVSFEHGLDIVARRASLMYQAGIEIPGTMVAVVGLDDETIRAVCDELNGVDGNVVVPANFNSPGQVVVSGSAEYLRASMPRFKERGAKLVKELPVSGAFHSPLLSAAQAGLEETIRATPFSDARIPVYVNVNASPLQRSEDLQTMAIRQLTSPVLWTQTIQAMAASGISMFWEVGPGKVLQGLIKRIAPDATVSGLDSYVDVQQYGSATQG